MKKPLFVSLLLCLHLVAFSQSAITQMLIDSSRQVTRFQSLADSLARAAYKEALVRKEYWGQFNGLQTIGAIYRFHNQPDSAYLYLQRAMQLAVAEDERANVGLCYIEIAKLQEYQGEPEAAISTIGKALAIFQEEKDSTKITFCYFTLGIIYSNSGEHELSVIHYLKALEIAEATQELESIADINQGIGIIYNKQKDFAKANEYFTKAMEAFRALEDTIGMLGVYNDFGILNKNQGKYQAAEKAYISFLEMASAPGYDWAKKFAYNNLGVLYYNMKQYEKGITYGREARSMWQAAAGKRSESVALNYLAKNQMGLGQNGPALQHAIEALRLAKAAGSLEKERDALITLSEAYERNDQPQLALEYFKAHKVAYDSIYNTEKTEQIHGLERRYQAEKKDKEILLLAKNAELDEVRNTRLWITLVATILLAATLLWSQMMRRRKDNMLHRKKQEIEKARRKVTESENHRLQQQLDFKQQELMSKVLQLCRKNEFLQSLDKQVRALKSDLEGSNKKQIDNLSRQINRDRQADADWEQFLQSFESVHPGFNRKVQEMHPEFSAGELRMAALLKMNLRSKDIAGLLNITPDGVKKTRYRMRKKMGADFSLNLTEYFMSIGTPFAAQ